MDTNYTVKLNDNLTKIAKTYKTDVNTLAKLNNIADINKIKTGQVLKLPSIAGSGQTVPNSQAVAIPNVIDSNIMNSPATPKVPTAPQKSVSVTGYKDNADGTTTNFLSDGSQSTVRYSKNADGSLTPVEVPYNAADKVLRDSEVQDTAAQKTAEELSKGIFNVLPKLEGEAADTSAALNDPKLVQLRQDLTDINSQILKKQAELSQDDITLINSMRNEERRDTLLPFAESAKAKLAGDASIARALKTSEIGVLNALALGKQGDLQLATDTAKDAVAAKYAPYKERINLYKSQLEALAPILSKDEKKQAREQDIRGNIALKEIDRAQKDEENAKALTLDLQKNGAPLSVINKALKAKTVQEIQAIPGISNYLLSKADRLDLAIKSKQLAALNETDSGISVQPGQKPSGKPDPMSAGFATRSLEANKILTQIETDKKSTVTSPFGGVNLDIGKLKGTQAKQYEQAQRNFINAVLRKESGANITKDEFDSAKEQYFGTTYDSKKVLLQKQRNRVDALNSLIGSAGKAYGGVFQEKPTTYLGETWQESGTAINDYLNSVDDSLLSTDTLYQDAGYDLQ